MKELMIIAATITPKEIIVEQLREALDQYVIDGDFDKLTLPCHLVVIKSMTGDDPDKAFSMVKDMEKVKGMMSLTDLGRIGS